MKTIIKLVFIVGVFVVLRPQQTQALYVRGLDQETAQQFMAQINYAPELSNNFLSGTWTEGTLVSLSFSATDPERQVLTVVMVGAPATSTLTKVGDTYEFKWQTGFNDAGVYNFSIVATDAGGASESLSVTITILDVPQYQGIQIVSCSPGTGTVTMHERSWTTFSIEAISLDGKTLAYSWTLNGSNTGVSTSTIFLAFNYNDAGTYTLMANITDGSSTASLRWIVVVVDVNRAPALTLLSVTGTKVNQPVVVEVAGSDPDGDTLTYGHTGPTGGTLTPTSIGTKWNWTPTTVGNYSVNIYAIDSRGGTASITTTLAIQQ
ncbi:hypothetical protein KKA09_00480 [Patescibacteria group bacterium]|nr:hypothetical protein [Patescibacteria group bacterium]